LIWFLALLAIGFFSAHFGTYSPSNCNVKHQLPFYRWDSFWYTSIARHGYSFSTEKNSSIAFFPLYPLIIKLTHFIIPTGEDKLSFVLNILFSFLAALFLWRLARFDYSEKTSRNIVLVFLFFPPAYFFLSGYPDVLFALLAILSLYFARKKQWPTAGIFSGLLAVTKPYGIFMFPALGLEYWRSHDWNFKSAAKKIDWLYLLLPIVTLGAFIYFNFARFHDPLAFLHTQKTWGRELGNPFLSLLREAKTYLLSGNIFTGENFPYLVYLASLIFSFFAGWASWKYVRKTYLVFPALILLAAFLTGTLTSWGRYMLLGFPILIGPSVFLSRRKWLFYIYLALSIAGLLFLTHLFVRCYPVE